MVPIKTSLILNDRMSSVLKTITRAMDLCVDGFEQIQTASEASFDPSVAQKMRVTIGQASAEIEEMEQSYRAAGNGQDDLNKKISQGQTLADGLTNKIKSLVGTYISLQGLKKGADFLSESISLFDTQNKAETQLKNVLKNVGAADSAFQHLKKTASDLQGQTMFGDEALLGGAAEFATYISDADAIESMMGTLTNYAAGMSGGAEVGYEEMVNYATGLGKVMTGSYDAMTKKGFEFTDAQKEIIENGTDMQKALVIDEVISESWNGLAVQMANTPVGKITQLKNAFGDIREDLASQVMPSVMQLFNTIGHNMPQISSMILGLSKPINIIVSGLAWMVEKAGEVYDFFSENWSMIAPIIYTIAAAMAAYAVISGVVAVANGIHATSEAVKAAAQTMATGATFAETAAQHGLNAALLACPITWIVLAVMAFIAALIAVCAWIAKTTGVAKSAFGVIMGGIFVVGATFKELGLLVADIALGIWNAIKALCSNMGTAFHNIISSIRSWFYDLLSTALDVIAGIAENLNRLPFVEFDFSGIENKASEYAQKAAEAAESKGEYENIGEAFSSGFNTYDAFGEGWASEAFANGAAWGDGISDKIKSSFDFGSFDSGSLTGSSAALTNAADDIANNTGGNGPAGETANNTGSIANSLDTTNEELKWLRDIAEREAINRFTTAEVKIDMTGMKNSFSSDIDIDGAFSRFTNDVASALRTTAAGVY